MAQHPMCVLLVTCAELVVGMDQHPMCVLLVTCAELVVGMDQHPAMTKQVSDWPVHS